MSEDFFAGEPPWNKHLVLTMYKRGGQDAAKMRINVTHSSNDPAENGQNVYTENILYIEIGNQHSRLEDVEATSWMLKNVEATFWIEQWFGNELETTLSFYISQIEGKLGKATRCCSIWQESTRKN